MYTHVFASIYNIFYMPLIPTSMLKVTSSKNATKKVYTWHYSKNWTEEYS